MTSPESVARLAQLKATLEASSRESAPPLVDRDSAIRCQRKTKFENRLAAETALMVSKSRWQHARYHSPGRVPPTRAYLCDHCAGWHLTSKEMT